MYESAYSVKVAALTINLIVVDIDALQLEITVANVLAVRANAVLVGDDLPELQTF
jgi:hypothetical protein